MASGASLSTLLVGIDGACPEVLDPLFDRDDLPTLQRLIETGASGALASQVPPWTASAWPSLYTGTNPGKHGVFGFLAFEGYDWRVVDATDVRQPPLWQLLDHHDRSSVVVNVPVTHPPRPFDGALVPGYTAPENPPCHPDGLLDDLRAAIGEYRVYPGHTGKADPGAERIVEEHVALAGMRGRAFRHLVDRFDPDFGFLQFQGTDSVVHECPGDRDALRRVYRAVDEEVAATVEACSPTNVVVASDHGVGPIGGYDVRVNDALRDAGLVETARGDGGMPSWATVRDRNLAAGEDGARPGTGLAERATAALARLGLTSQRAADLLEPLGLTGPVSRLVPTSAISAATEHVDFPTSRAYVRSRIECGVRLNLRGREPDGVVPPDEYEATRDRVVDVLSALSTPDGDPVFEAVAPRERFFEGGALERAPDVVTVPKAFDHLLSAQLRGAVLGEPREPWNHKRDGIVALRGDDVDEERGLGASSAGSDADEQRDVGTSNDADEQRGVDGAHLFDVAPTVLATLGVPAAERMDGAALAPVDPCGVQVYPDVERDAAGTERSAAVEARLADLGYLE